MAPSAAVTVASAVTRLLATGLVGLDSEVRISLRASLVHASETGAVSSATMIASAEEAIIFAGGDSAGTVSRTDALDAGAMGILTMATMQELIRTGGGILTPHITRTIRVSVRKPPR